MNSWWLLIGAASLVGAAAVGDMVSEEIRTRLDVLPRWLLKLAARRVDPDIRAELLQEWNGELHQFLRGPEARPVVRLWRGLCHAAGLLVVAPRVGHILGRLIRQKPGTYRIDRIQLMLGEVKWQIVEYDELLMSAGVRPSEPGEEFPSDDMLKAQKFLSDHGFSAHVIFDDSGLVAVQNLNRWIASSGR